MIRGPGIGIGSQLGGGAAEPTALETLQALLDDNNQNGIYDVRTESAGSGALTDLSNNSNNATSYLSRAFQSIDPDLGGLIHASGMQWTFANATAASSATFILSMRLDDADNDAFFTLTLRANASNPPVYPVTVDGVTHSTSPNLFNAIDGGGQHTMSWAGSESALGRTSAGWLGRLRKLVKISQTQVTGGDYTAALAAAIAWADE